MKIVEVLMVLGWFYLNSVLPSLSEKFRAGKSAEIADILWTSLKVLISFSLCIFIFWSSLARDIISVIATPEYINPISHSFNSPFALSLALWVLVFHFVSLAFIYVLIASERQWLLLRINIWITLINIIWNIILIPYYSFIWAAVITLISQGILMCVSAYIVLKDISIPKKYYISIVKTLLLWAFMLLVFRFVLLRTNAWSIWNVFVFGTLFALIYAWIEYKMSRKLFFK
jgi:O-antigen/teichoic acid export membrane protein